MLVSAKPEISPSVRALSNILPSVLIVDDDVVAASELAETLELEGFNCIAASTLEQALSLPASFPSIRVIITDFYLHGAVTATANGLALIDRVREMFPERSFNFIVVSGDQDVLVDCALTGSGKFLAKPIAPESICSMVQDATEHDRMAAPDAIPEAPDASVHRMVQVQADAIASLTAALNDARNVNRKVTTRMDRLVSAATIAAHRNDQVSPSAVGDLLSYVVGQGYAVKKLLKGDSELSTRTEIATLSN